MSTHQIISRLQAEYARCIDNERFEEWPGYFEEKCLYKVTTAENHKDGLEAGLIYADSRGMLIDRISALREANIYEPHSYRHIIGQTYIHSEDERQARGETPFLVVRVMRSGETTIFASGRYLDCYHLRGDYARFIERIVVCDSSRIDTLLVLPL